MNLRSFTGNEAEEMCKMYWHTLPSRPAPPRPLSTHLPLAARCWGCCLSVSLSVGLSVRGVVRPNSKLLPLQFIKQIDIACYYTRQMPTPTQNRKRLGPIDRIKLNIYSRICVRFLFLLSTFFSLSFYRSNLPATCFALISSRLGDEVICVRACQRPDRALGASASRMESSCHKNPRHSNYMQQASQVAQWFQPQFQLRLRLRLRLRLWFRLPEPGL